MPVDELVDNRWTTGPNLGATSPVLWMIRAIPQNLEKRSPRLLRGPSVSVRNLSRHQRRSPGSEGNLRVSGHKDRELAQASARSPESAAGCTYLAGRPGKAPSGRQTPSRPGSAQALPSDGGVFRGFADREIGPWETRD